ncbi:hypothetical protein RD110_07950 [Rhodoferax koreense]|uniref:Uncharacterized protein n=2 Tax=Rhodoferax koreensis TaxID=1842727 RepID=A0A1P8JTP3_9BURK|nr:hypothetical protein RD110_07950 [Rhodoferax koreense]
MQKRSIRWSGFKARSNHAGHLIGVAEVADGHGITIPGVTVQIEIKAPVDASRCLYLFSLMQQVKGQRGVVYQLEVAPAEKRTHNGHSPIYGPHEHVGREEEPTPVTSSAVTCNNWKSSLAWFFLRVNVQAFPIEDPTEPC